MPIVRNANLTYPTITTALWSRSFVDSRTYWPAWTSRLMQIQYLKVTDYTCCSTNSTDLLTISTSAFASSVPARYLEQRSTSPKRVSACFWCYVPCAMSTSCSVSLVTSSTTALSSSRLRYKLVNPNWCFHARHSYDLISYLHHLSYHHHIHLPGCCQYLTANVNTIIHMKYLTAVYPI